ncbi:hypothetical protein Hanom_Chr04g00360371 [Helianthus anomalus]
MLHKVGLKYELSHYPQLKRNFAPKFGTHSLRKLGKLYCSLVFLGCHRIAPINNHTPIILHHCHFVQQ